MHLADAPKNPLAHTRSDALIGALVDVVKAMDKGAISAGDTKEVFAHFRIPGFSFQVWLEQMMEKGIYLKAVQDKAG